MNDTPSIECGTAAPPQVFVADDDREMRNLIGASLRRDGYDVHLVDSGGELLTELDATREAGGTPELVITDVRMPGLDGLEVLRRIRETMPSVPVILITAFGDARTHERARSLGATFVLDKPFRLDVLRERIGVLIGAS